MEKKYGVYAKNTFYSKNGTEFNNDDRYGTLTLIDGVPVELEWSALNGQKLFIKEDA